MLAKFRLALLFLPMASGLAPFAAACTCASTLGACDSVKISNLVFIGTVEAIEPALATRWQTGNHDSWLSLNAAYMDAEEHPSPASFGRLRDALGKMLTNLSVPDKNRFDHATTMDDLISLANSVFGREVHARFKVKKLYKRQLDDDDDDAAKKPAAKAADTTAGTRVKKDDDDDDDRKPGSTASEKEPKKPAQKITDDDDDDDFITLTTPFGDCGYDFQTGETYLVYASNEEGENVFFTERCSRTKRLSEAGEDLSYLFFYSEQPNESARIEGFATTDRLDEMRFDPLRNSESVKAPVADVVVELKSGLLTRYTQSNATGRYVFDGIPAGDYTLSAFASGFPSSMQLMAGPHNLDVDKKSCNYRFLVVPPSGGKK